MDEHRHFPYLLEVVSELAIAELAIAGYDYDGELLTGLDLILDGIDHPRPQ